MRYGNRSSSRRILSSPIALIVLLILFAILVKAAWNAHTKAVLSQTKLDDARNELAKLQERQADLSTKVAYLSTDQGLQAEMRDKFHAVKDGESVAVIVDNSQSANAIQASSTASIGWWGRFLHFFGL